MKYDASHRSFLTVSDNRWSCGRAIFQGNPASKTNKTSSPFHNNIVLEIFSAANLALVGFPLTNALGENLPSRH